MSQIKAEIVGDAISQNGNRITSFLLTYPRIIHSELMTHRVFSRSSSSSRAVKFEKMVEAVESNPFIPIAWQKDHKGMQGTEYITDPKAIERLETEWKTAALNMVKQAQRLNSGIVCRETWEEDFKEKYGVTKQLCNRLLEPFMWHTTLVTSTTYSNFFELRCPSYQTKEGLKKSWKETCFDELALPLERLQVNQGQGEIHIMALAEAMYDAYNESVPKPLLNGEWYIPFEDKLGNLDNGELAKFAHITNKKSNLSTIDTAVRVATARCARTSYTVVGEDKVSSYDKDLKLHDRLLESGHWSPFEHCAMNMEDSNSYGNFTGWKQYRQFIENGEF